MFGLYSMFTVPLVLFIRHLVENHRLNCQKRAALKAMTLPLEMRADPERSVRP
jgi:hypothetical protein